MPNEADRLFSSVASSIQGMRWTAETAAHRLRDLSNALEADALVVSAADVSFLEERLSIARVWIDEVVGLMLQITQVKHGQK